MKIMHRQRPLERNVLRIVVLYNRMRENPHVNIAGSGKLSSDRTIAEYAADSWNAKSCPVP
jgi:glucan phosphorylase